MVWVTVLTITDGDFHQMLQSGELPQGTRKQYGKAADMDGALAIVAQAYDKQRRGIAKLIGKPKIATIDGF